MTLHWRATGIEVHKVVVGATATYSLLVHRDGRCSSLDAANEHEQFWSYVKAWRRTVVETHGHWDHVQAIPAIRDAGYEVGVAADSTMPSYDFIMEDDSVIEIGRLRVRTIHNPGHTPGPRAFISKTRHCFFRTHSFQGSLELRTSKEATSTQLSRASRTACSQIFRRYDRPTRTWR